MPRNPYSPHPGVEMVQQSLRTLKDKTGRTLDEWLKLVKKQGLTTHATIKDWLRKQKVDGNRAFFIASKALGEGLEDSPEAYLEQAVQYVDAMFAGPKAALRPLYDRLLEVVLAVGKDAKASPGKTIVPIYRNHVFAQIKPATRARIDLGLALGNMKTPRRLIDTGGYEKKDRITRRIEVGSPADIDADLKKWLTTAYELDA